MDKNPGDRAEMCMGMMRPTALEGASPHYDIQHRCEKCGFERRNKAVANDSEEALLALARRAGDGA